MGLIAQDVVHDVVHSPQAASGVDGADRWESRPSDQLQCRCSARCSALVQLAN